MSTKAPPTIRERIEAQEATSLAPAAVRSEDAGRPQPEEECTVRTRFQRDRDRILHTSSFRRLMHKTQVFIAPTGDHFRTRLTHTLEVTQVARTIGRALRLNEDLIEAIGLAHDLGHTPFGHAGEVALAESFPGFRHNEQSLRVVDRLERGGRGLNLTDPVRDGILRHSKYRSGIVGTGGPSPASLEGQVVRIADAIAYINHDLDDALRAGLIDPTDVPRSLLSELGASHANRINRLVCDVIEQSDTESPPGRIGLSPDARAAADHLRDFLFERVYTPINEQPDTRRAQHIVRALFAHYAADWVASMTDRYAIDLFERLFVPRHWSA